jgi:DNA-binding HxlR family transcriptional regulator
MAGRNISGRRAVSRREQAAGVARLHTSKARRTAPAAAPGLDQLIHERMRLGIVSALAVNDKLSFNELKELLATSDGNLSVHARKLEDGGYIACNKYFEGRTPRTDFRLTAAGKRALEKYLDEMEGLIKATRNF